MSNQENIFQTDNLSKTYGDFGALMCIDLSVQRHAIAGFLGSTGISKSMAVKLLLGLRRTSAVRGSIVGLNSVEESTLIRDRVGYLAQYPRFDPNRPGAKRGS